MQYLKESKEASRIKAEWTREEIVENEVGQGKGVLCAEEPFIHSSPSLPK